MTEEQNKLADEIERCLKYLSVRHFKHDAEISDVLTRCSAALREREPKGETWTRNIFRGEPPPSYKNWFDFCASPVKTGVLIRAAEPIDWFDGTKPKVERVLREREPATEAVLEMAAKECERMQKTWKQGGDWQGGCLECADAIRALKHG